MLNLRYTLTAFTITLLMSASVSAHILWPVQLGGSTGVMETTGELDEHGNGGGVITSFAITSSQDQGIPVTTWTASGYITKFFAEDLNNGQQYFAFAGLKLTATAKVSAVIDGFNATLSLPQTVLEDTTGPYANAIGVSHYDLAACGFYVSSVIADGGNASYADCYTDFPYQTFSLLSVGNPYMAPAEVDPGQPGAVPEPSSLALLGLGALALLRRRK